MNPYHALQSSISTTFLCLLLTSPTDAARKTNPAKVPKNAVLLSDISTLTLRSGKQTAHRRVSSVPQTKCIGPKDVCTLYGVDVMRCTNAGSDYDPDNVQWTCTASLPSEFKLGSTDVTCEGYESSEDPYVLKGSCGVEYRLLLTEKGEERYGRRGTGWWDSVPSRTNSDSLSKLLFWIIFSLVAIVILKAVFTRRNIPGRRAGGGDGFGWGGGGPDDDPPPPYEPPRKPRTRPANSSNRRGGGAGQRWEPGFWSGALGGAAAGYTAGSWANRQTPARNSSAQPRSWFGGGSNDPGEGSSRSPPSFSSSRHESSGFGSSSRR